MPGRYTPLSRKTLPLRGTEGSSWARLPRLICQCNIGAIPVFCYGSKRICDGPDLQRGVSAI